MKVLAGIFAAVGILCLLVGIPLGIGGFSDFQNDQALERYPAEVVSLRTEDAYVRPVVRYNYKGTDYQIIIRNQDFYQGEKLQVIFRDDTPGSAEVYRDSPFQYGKVLGACMLVGCGVTFLAVAYLLLRIDKHIESNNPLGFMPPLFLTIGITALCVLIAINVVVRLPQNRDNEQDYPRVSATLVMVPHTSTDKETNNHSSRSYSYTVTNDYGDTVAEYEYNGKTYKAKVSNNKEYYVGKRITLYIKHNDPGLAKEKLNDTGLLTLFTVIFTFFGALFIFFGILIRKLLKR